MLSMKKLLLFFILFLSFQTFAQSIKEAKTNFQFNIISGNLPLNLDKVVENVKSAGYSDGKFNKSNLSFGGGFEMNINKFQFEVGILLHDKTKQSFNSPTNTLDIFTTAASTKFGRNFWIAKNLKLSLLAGPYFQNVSLNIEPVPNNTILPKTLIDFLANPVVSLKEYSISSNLGGIDSQLKLNYYFLSKKNKHKENTIDGLSVFVALNYRNQFFDKGNWKFSASQSTNSNNNNGNNSSNTTTLKFPNKHDFETSGLMLSIGLSFHTSYLRQKIQKTNLTSIIHPR